MSNPDPRHLGNGHEIPTESYCDQPFVVQTDDGAWLCCVTTGPGEEGARGQHVATLRSTDQGRTWSAPLPVEPADSPENSYAVMLKVPSGRVYIFYNHNTDNVREALCHDRQHSFKRVDSLGYYVCRYSDDHGKSWSANRYVVDVREFACDRENVYGGKLRFFWNVGKPFIHQGAAYLSLHKVGQMGVGFFQQSEGVLIRCPEMVAGDDPSTFTWETLPDGDIGLRTPPGGGPISEEHSYCVLSDGSFHVVYRTIDGYPVETYSRDGGHTWQPPRYVRDVTGRLVKHPRAATFAWKCRNGKYLWWHHNLGGHFVRDFQGKPSGTNGLVVGGGSPYDDRNPVWLAGGVEVDTPCGREIAWSQPEIALYHDDPYVRISYPDLIEEDGKVFLTETQKETARVHELPPALLEALWNPPPGPATAGLVLDAAGGAEIATPALPELLVRDHERADYGTKDRRAGFTVDISFTLPDLAPGRVLVDTRTPAGQGLALVTTDRGTIELVLNDGRTENRWDCDPERLVPGRRQHLTAIVDGGPKVILFVVDGLLSDGGEYREFGWGRFSPNLRGANGSDRLRIAECVHRLRLYDRALYVAEAVANGK